MNTQEKAQNALRMNLAALNRLISQCEQLGKKYKPTAAKLKTKSLNELKEQVEQVMREKGTAVKAYIDAGNSRLRQSQALESMLDKIAHTPAQGDPGTEKQPRFAPPAPEETASNEKSLFYRLSRITNFKDMSTGDGDQTDTREGSPAAGTPHRLWLHNQAENLAGLAQEVSKEDTDILQAADITPNDLSQLAREMQEQNDAISAAAAALEQADVRLGQLFYDPENGLVATAQAAKDYLLTATEEADAGAIRTLMFHAPAIAESQDTQS